ncbi:MAG: hypothetical protein ACFFBY_05995 [Promethearchaeota archaeon]
MINTSKKYQKRVKRLKDHKNDEEGRPHQEKIKSYSSNIKVSQLKKNDKKIHKKLDKSEYTWL